MYGLKESPRNWYECSNSFIFDSGFERNGFDYCLYYTKDNVNRIFIILFVDDSLICGKDANLILSTKCNLSDKFKMKDLGNVKSYLGMDTVFDLKNKVTTLSQENYIKSLARKYNIINANLFDT